MNNPTQHNLIQERSAVWLLFNCFSFLDQFALRCLDPDDIDHGSVQPFDGMGDHSTKRTFLQDNKAEIGLMHQ